VAEVTTEAHDAATVVPRDPFRHEALFYAGDDEFVEGCAAFVREGRGAGEPTLVVAAARKLAGLREALGGDADGVAFADMAEVGRNPARIIPAWHEFVERHAAPGVRLRGIGEPIFPERAPQELVECERHEALLNVAFSDVERFWLLCPYDTEALPDEVIEEARRNHPYLANGRERARSETFGGVTALGAPFDRELPEPPALSDELPFEHGALEQIRRLVSGRASDAGLRRSRALDLVVAVNEIATNSLAHGGGSGVLRVWSEPDRLVCEVRDGGRIEDPLVGRRLPDFGDPTGRGLWLANQLCDLVQVRTLARGTVVRLHAARG
jgi:anti-sigma regulatory factor (Ser/Thr protein kinase)